MKPPVSIEAAAESVEKLDYDAGVPLGLGVLAPLLFAWTLPGIRMFDGLTRYGKFGVVVALAVTAGVAIAAIYTYRRLDISKYMTTRDGDNGGDAD